MKLRDLFNLDVQFGRRTDEPVIELAAGEVTEIEAGRSGTFRPRRGPKSLTLTKADLAAIAKNFDPKEPHKITVGHKPVEPHTPDLGDVTGARYDVKKDRLFFSVKPTESLVEKNRKGEFHAPSMELTKLEDGTYTLGNLTVLGAHKPAIGDLKRIELAEGDDETVFVCLADLADGPDDDEEVDGSRIDLATTNAAAAASTTEQEEIVEKEKLELAEARIKKLEADNKKFAESDVERFLSSDQAAKKIPLPLLKSGDLKRVLLAAAALEETAGKVMLAAADGKSEVESSLYEAIKKIFLGLPDKLKGSDAVETALNGVEDAEIDPVQFAGEDVDLASVKQDAAVRALMAAEKANGKEISYLEGVRSIQMAARASGGRR